MIVIFERHGRRPAGGNNPPLACHVCEPIEAGIRFDYGFDTERDARLAYLMQRGELLHNLWHLAWDHFICPPARQTCDIREACENAPVYIEAGAVIFRCLDGKIRFHIYARLVRRIRCVHDGEEEDVEPRFPVFRTFKVQKKLEEGKPGGIEKMKRKKVPDWKE